MFQACSSSSVALQLIDSSDPSSMLCTTFDGLPLADNVQICIAAEAGLFGRSQQLFTALESTIAQVAQGGPSSTCQGSAGLNCSRYSDQDVVSILVAVLTDQPVSNAMKNLMDNWLQPNSWNKRILPVMPRGADPTRVLPAPLDKLIVLREPAVIDYLAPDILRSSGIGSEAFRLFISYRRLDAEAAADQLFGAFSQAGFDVFLDRFRGVPGRSFPQLLEEFLVDKGLVVVIESPNVQQSPWTKHEVQFAQNFRLGLMALPMPAGAPFGAVSAVDRWSNGSDPASWSDGYGNLATSQLRDPDAFVSFVRQRYALQTLYRRFYLEYSLQTALAGERLQSTRQPNGTHIVNRCYSSYSIGLSARPPSLEEARRVCEAGQSLGGHRVLVGPVGYMPPEKHANMKWVASQLQIALREDGQMRSLAQDIRHRRSLP